MEKIGFVGVGRMGANMARRLKDQDFAIAAVYDVNLEAARTLVESSGSHLNILVESSGSHLNI
jgi:3-hydroxyisobutyrate dehydrogenase